jgi:hypothetical protein
MGTAQPEEPQFASMGAVLAYEHRKHGAEHLERVLAALIEAGETRREFMLRAATELKVLNHAAADTVLAAAAQCPSMVDLRFCSYDESRDSANVQAWLRNQERQTRKRIDRCEALLEQAGIDIGWLTGAIGQ